MHPCTTVAAVLAAIRPRLLAKKEEEEEEEEVHFQHQLEWCRVLNFSLLVTQFYKTRQVHPTMLTPVFRRSLTTLIPPKIASPSNLGSNPAAKRMQHIVNLYSKLPRGQATFETPRTPFAIYREKYRGSGAPVLHFAVTFLLIGYGLEYYFHLSHEKEHGHH